MKILFSLLVALILLVASVEGAEQKKAQPNAKKAPSTRSILKGSRSSQVRQNQKANAEKLSRIKESQLDSFEDSKLLVPLPKGPGLRIDGRLDSDLRLCRPQTAKFLIATGWNFHKQFGNALQVNSAVRTVEHQKRLRGTNANAAKVSGPTASSHLTGSTVDIAKIGMSSAELIWMRGYLARLEQQGYIEATEEFRQKVFHVMVFKKYLTYGKTPAKKAPPKKKR